MYENPSSPISFDQNQTPENESNSTESKSVSLDDTLSYLKKKKAESLKDNLQKKKEQLLDLERVYNYLRTYQAEKNAGQDYKAIVSKEEYENQLENSIEIKELKNIIKEKQNLFQGILQTLENKKSEIINTLKDIDEKDLSEIVNEQIKNKPDEITKYSREEIIHFLADTLIKNSSEHKNAELLEADIEELLWDLEKKQLEIELQIADSNRLLKEKLQDLGFKDEAIPTSSELQSAIEKLSLEIKELEEQLPEKILEREKEKKNEEENKVYLLNALKNNQLPTDLKDVYLRSHSDHRAVFKNLHGSVKRLLNGLPHQIDDVDKAINFFTSVLNERVQKECLADTRLAKDYRYMFLEKKINENSAIESINIIKNLENKYNESLTELKEIVNKASDFSLFKKGEGHSLIDSIYICIREFQSIPFNEIFVRKGVEIDFRTQEQFLNSTLDCLNYFKNGIKFSTLFQKMKLQPEELVDNFFDNNKNQNCRDEISELYEDSYEKLQTARSLYRFREYDFLKIDKIPAMANNDRENLNRQLTFLYGKIIQEVCKEVYDEREKSEKLRLINQELGENYSSVKILQEQIYNFTRFNSNSNSSRYKILPEYFLGYNANESRFSPLNQYFLSDQLNENLLEYDFFTQQKNSTREVFESYQDLDITIHNQSLSNGEDNILYSFVKIEKFCKKVDDLKTQQLAYRESYDKLRSIVNMIYQCRDSSHDKKNQKEILKKICNNLVSYFGNDEKYTIGNYLSGIIFKEVDLNKLKILQKDLDEESSELNEKINKISNLSYLRNSIKTTLHISPEDAPHDNWVQNNIKSYPRTTLRELFELINKRALDYKKIQDKYKIN